VGRNFEHIAEKNQLATLCLLRQRGRKVTQIGQGCRSEAQIGKK